VAEDKVVAGNGTSKFKQAVTWAVEESIKNHAGCCGVCTWRPWEHATPRRAANSLTQHIRRKHRDTIVDLFDHEVLDLSTLRQAPAAGLSEDELLAAAGISEIESLDYFDALAIPKDIKTRMESDGSVPRWVRRDRVDHFKGQGAKAIQLNGKGEGVRQPSTEDNILKANEMVCMELPYGLAEDRRRQKEQRVSDQLNSRAEEQKITTGEYEGAAYDYLRQHRGADHQQAKQISRALNQRRQREDDEAATQMSLSQR
jgi:hypothetical protein